MKLREYQVNSIQDCRVALAMGMKRVVLYAPTGAGKSVIAEALTKFALEKGKRVAIIANRIHLVKQMSDRFAASKIAHGILQGQNTIATNLPVVICSIDTVHARSLPDVDFVIVDEAHACAGSKKYRELFFKYNAIPVIGLTATPFSKGMAKPYPELNGAPLFEELVIATTIKELIKEGNLVDCDIYAPSEPDLKGVRMTKNSFGEMDFNEQDLADAIDKPTLVGDIVKHWLQLSNRKPTIVFATSIAHSQHIVGEFQRAGVSAKHLDCYMPEEDKERIQADFKAGKFTVLSNCSLLAEGFDYPACEVMVLARPTKSLIRYIQMVGRILRPFHGKDRGLLLDHSGSVSHLGFPTDDLPLELDDGTARQTPAAKKAEEPKPTKCGKCSYMKPPKTRVCPRCGAVNEVKNEVEHEDGVLVKVKKMDKKSKQDIYSECIGLARLRGKPDTWAAGLYKHITGVWPRSLDYIDKSPSVETMNKELERRVAYAKRMEKEGAYVRP